ncbi:MAG: polyprenyl synthetase family protein, partial [Candidatus Bathyarchaeia archaeon]
HTASLIHDDVVDEDRHRRGVDTLYKTWKNTAILTGDTFYALACNIITTYGPKIWQVVSDGAIELCDGQFMDVTLTLDNCGEKEYFEKITKKSASLFKVSSRSGAMVGGGSNSEVEALGEYGKFFGVTYQLRDDMLEVINDAASDLRNGRVTLPYLHLYSNGNSSVRHLLEQNFGKKRPRSAVLRLLKASLKEAGSLDYCRGKISEILDQALKSLAGLRNSQHKEQLVLFAETTLKP